MIVSIQQIKAAFRGESKEMIALKKEHKKLLMHYNGIGVKEYLEQITGYENAEQKQLRDKYARSNKDLFSNITSPVHKVFTAKGKNKDYHFSTKNTDKVFRDKLSTVDNGKSLENWLRSYWKDKIAVDPNGLFMVEIDKEGNAYPTYKSILSIRAYEQKGQKVEYVIFEPVEYEDGKDKYYKIRVYDSEGDKTYKIQGDAVTLVVDESFVNPWKEVPAVVISDIENTVTGYKRASIYEEIELADEYLLNNSVKSIYKFAHGYPLFWMYLQTCPTCKGEKEVSAKTCTSCNGTGYSLKKDVSDVIGIKPPETPDDVTITPDIAGYVTPPSENLEQMTGELFLLKDMMWFSQWGTTIEKGENETATGRFIDAQPVNEKLNVYSDSLEVIETILTDYFGQYWYASSYKGSSINYGRRYLIETPDQMLDRYRTAKEKNLSTTLLDYLLVQYYQSQFTNDPMMLMYHINLMRVEPWVHLSLSEVPTQYQNTKDYNNKVYFGAWKSEQSIEDVANSELKDLNKSLNNFVEQKTEQNE